MLEQVAKSNVEYVRIIKANVAQDRRWAVKEKIRAVPTFKLYQGGMLVDTFRGYSSQEVIEEKIKKYSKSIRKQSATASKGKGANGEQAKSKQPAIQKMPKNWLPPGVTAE